MATKQTQKKKKKKLTLKEQSFVKEVLETNNPTEAADRVYNTKSREISSVMGTQMMNKEHIRGAVMEAMDNAGLTIDYLMVEQKKVVDQEDNLNVKQRGIEHSSLLLDAYAPKQTEHKSVNISIEAQIKDARISQAMKNFLGPSKGK